eukprot:356586-Chlamydomonas_euryale.AAC.4
MNVSGRPGWLNHALQGSICIGCTSNRIYRHPCASHPRMGIHACPYTSVPCSSHAAAKHERLNGTSDQRTHAHGPGHAVAGTEQEAVHVRAERFSCACQGRALQLDMLRSSPSDVHVRVEPISLDSAQTRRLQSLWPFRKQWPHRSNACRSKPYNLSRPPFLEKSHLQVCGGLDRQCDAEKLNPRQQRSISIMMATIHTCSPALDNVPFKRAIDPAGRLEKADAAQRYLIQ